MSNPYEAPQSLTDKPKRRWGPLWIGLAVLMVIMVLLAAMGFATFRISGSSEDLTEPKRSATP